MMQSFVFKSMLPTTLYGFIFRKSSGVKTFSNCSLSDFKSFILNMGAKCLQNKPQMQVPPKAVCGNGKVESPEVCDCGTVDVSLITRKID